MFSPLAKQGTLVGDRSWTDLVYPCRFTLYPCNPPTSASAEDEQKSPKDVFSEGIYANAQASFCLLVTYTSAYNYMRITYSLPRIRPWHSSEGVLGECETRDDIGCSSQEHGRKPLYFDHGSVHYWGRLHYRVNMIRPHAHLAYGI